MKYSRINILLENDYEIHDKDDKRIHFYINVEFTSPKERISHGPRVKVKLRPGRYALVIAGYEISENKEKRDETGNNYKECDDIPATKEFTKGMKKVLFEFLSMDIGDLYKLPGGINTEYKVRDFIGDNYFGKADIEHVMNKLIYKYQEGKIF